ncbi:hypothetical protein niasHS_011077 [Heterodera schachtii]|uniref:BZIP domain-containing protein n=1 Tax=Heterodera schachtii TaxID=97005 RepID=A0ABD2J034_HETSC
MASLSAALQSQHGTTAAHRHFHTEPFVGSTIRFQLSQSAASAGVVPSPAPLFTPLAPSAHSVGPSPSHHHNLVLNHFLLSSAPSTSSSLLNAFGRSSLRQPFHSPSPHWLTLEGMAPLTTAQFPPTETYADPSQHPAKELADQQLQQCSQSVGSDASTFSFSCSASGDSDGRSCSSGSFSGTHQQNVHQRTSTEQNANNVQLSKVLSVTQNAQQTEPNGQQRPKKSLVRDEAYWERRRKNNDAAKRSRDSRRKKEDEVAVRAVVLEQENLQLRFEVERLRTEIERHRIVAFGDALIAAANAENAVEIAVGKVPISSAAMAQLTTAATAMGMAKQIVNP